MRAGSEESIAMRRKPFVMTKSFVLGKSFVLALGLGLALGAAPAGAVTFRYAFQGDVKSLDPYTLKETFTIAAHAASTASRSRRRRRPTRAVPPATRT